MSKDTPLSPKYLKALDLINEGNLSYKDIAKASGVHLGILYNLIEGSYTKGPELQKKFSEALDSINKQKDKKIRMHIKNCKDKTFSLIYDYLTKFKDVSKTDKELMSTLVSVANALSKSTPNVEIGQFTFQKGLSPEDIYGEFKRLTGLTFDRGAVQGPSAGGTGALPMASGPRVTITEEPENPLLQGESEA